MSIIDLRGKQAEGRAQTEYGWQTTLDHEKSEESLTKRGHLDQETKRLV